MVSSAPEVLSSLVCHLGGPNIASTDIEWAMDLPTGKCLIEWIADQLEEGLDVSPAAKGYDGKSLNMQISFEKIALEDEEVQFLKREELERLHGSHSDEAALTIPCGYTVPSKQRSRVEFMDAETELFEKETSLLKHRLQQTKKAAQRASQTAKAIQAALHDADDKTGHMQQQLGELSLAADAAIGLSLQNAHQVLNSLENKPSDGPKTPRTPHRSVRPRIHEIKSALSTLSVIRSDIVDRSRVQLSSIADSKKSLPSLMDIQYEVTRLSGLFADNTCSNPSAQNESRLSKAAESIVYLDELVDLCHRLESKEPPDEILKEITPDTVDQRLGGADVKSTLENSWDLDQMAILIAREKVLDETLADFSSCLLPSLTHLYHSLSTSNQQTCDAEALVGALIEEIEEVADDVRDAKALSDEPSAREGSVTKDEILLNGLLDVLKSLEQYRATNAPPLILLDRADVLSELMSVTGRASVSDHEEGEWSSHHLTGELSTVADVHSPLLTAMYQNSPMNTSPPLAHPNPQVVLEMDIRGRANELQASILKLQKDLEVSSRTKKRLHAFVEKWGRNP